jgi:cholesterol transport system auxiliary component
MKALAALVLAGCALTSRSHPSEFRYFTPERTEHSTTRTPDQPRGELRIGRITAAANLRYAIVHRDSSVEVEPYHSLRWTALPDAYVHHALLRALFEERPLVQAVSGDAPTLDVEVTAFEEVRGVRPRGRVELSYVLQDDSAVILRGTVDVERPAGSAEIEAIVPAIRTAMLDATSQLADRVTTALEQRPPRAPEGQQAAAR